MARKLDGEQQADLTAFVNALADRAGYTTTAEWSRDSGYPAPNLSNLRNANGAIDGYNLLRLIRAASDRIAVDPVDLAAGLATAADGSPESIADRLEAVEETMTELAKLIREGLEVRAAPESSASRRGSSRGGRAE
jgi:hypothetical protein